MSFQRFLPVLACGTLALGLSSCGLFSSKQQPVGVAEQQQFDPFSNTWKPSTQVITPPPSEPNATLAEQQAAAKREAGALKKAGRAVGNTAGAVGRAVKKPLSWLPFGKKDEVPIEEVQPAVVPPQKTAAQ